MKKLMILILALSLVLTANASTGIELSFNGLTDGPGNVTNRNMHLYEEVVIDVHGPEGYEYLGYIVIDGDAPDYGEWGDEGGAATGYYYAAGYPVVHPNAGDLAYALRYVEAGWGYGYEVTAADAEGGIPGGLQFDFRYRCATPISTYTTITLWDNAEGYDTPQDTIVIHHAAVAPCFPTDHPDYDEWVAVGKPECWCYPRQCHGDADGVSQGKQSYWAATCDLEVLKAAWNKPLPEVDDETITTSCGDEVTLICADFDHLACGKIPYRVCPEDLAILKEHWAITNGPEPNCFDPNFY